MKTRKLKDLKENECIKVNTLKEAKFFVKKIPFDIAPHIIVGDCLMKEDKKIYRIDEEDVSALKPTRVIIPASDFIKPKRKSWRKKIEKELNYLSDVVANMNIKADVSKTEITELPEKWCFYYEKDYYETVKNYLNWKSPLLLTEGFLYSGIEGICGVTPIILKDHTLISQSDFERLVLNKHLQQDEPSKYSYSSIEFREQLNHLESEKIHTQELVVGRWYKGTYVDENDPVNKSIFCITKIEHNEVYAYGFDYTGEWNDYSCGWGRADCKGKVLATNEEVESALIAEAKKRGFKEYAAIHSPNAECNAILKKFDKYVYRPEENILSYMYDGVMGIPVFNNGKWAEIIQEKEIDWSVAGQLVSNDKGYIWITSGKHSKDTFEATYISHGEKEAFKLGGISSDCVKSSFKLFNGSILLKNE